MRRARRKEQTQTEKECLPSWKMMVLPDAGADLPREFAARVTAEQPVCRAPEDPSRATRGLAQESEAQVAQT